MLQHATNAMSQQSAPERCWAAGQPIARAIKLQLTFARMVAKLEFCRVWRVQKLVWRLHAKFGVIRNAI